MSRQVPLDQFEGLGLLPMIILVKVAGIGGWIEELLPQREYNAAKIASKRRKEAEELGISFGVKRDGMDDTGCNVICNRQFMKLNVFLAELALMGYKVTEASWFWKDGQGGNRKRMLQMVYTKTGDAVPLPDRINHLLANTTPYCNVWANIREDGEELYRLDTINIPTPRPNMVAEEELHASFSEGRNTYLVTIPR